MFGAAHIDKKRLERAHRRERTRRAERADIVDPPSADGDRTQSEAKVFSALCNLGFGKRQVRQVMAELRQREVTPEPEPLLRAGLALLVPG